MAETLELLGFSVPQVAHSLNVSERVIWKEIHEGNLQCTRIRRRVIVTRKQLETYLQKNTVKVVNGRRKAASLFEGVNGKMPRAV